MVDDGGFWKQKDETNGSLWKDWLWFDGFNIVIWSSAFHKYRHSPSTGKHGDNQRFYLTLLVVWHAHTKVHWIHFYLSPLAHIVPQRWPCSSQGMLGGVRSPIVFQVRMQQSNFWTIKKENSFDQLFRANLAKHNLWVAEFSHLGNEIAAKMLEFLSNMDGWRTVCVSMMWYENDQPT